MINKIELTWIGKDEPVQIEPRRLIEQPELSNVAADPDTANMLIHGDNLLALKALESEFAGQVKCIYIDPPYNTVNAFDQEDDNIKHSIWLNQMDCRFRLLHSLLRKDGFLFVNLDEQEHAYAKVLLDEIFGRQNFIGDIIWQRRKGGGNDSYYFALDHDSILVYAKDASKELHPVKWRTAQSGRTLHHKGTMDHGQVQGSILDDVGTNHTAGEEMEHLFGDRKAFPCAKPEKLISRILELSTEEGDLVLDSFLGSGTTAAVAHKMGRRYIGIEIGDYAYTHCKVRLDKVIAGEDPGGITKSAGWQSGGGYRFYELKS